MPEITPRVTCWGVWRLDNRRRVARKLAFACANINIFSFGFAFKACAPLTRLSGNMVLDNVCHGRSFVEQQTAFAYGYVISSEPSGIASAGGNFDLHHAFDWTRNRDEGRSVQFFGITLPIASEDRSDQYL